MKKALILAVLAIALIPAGAFASVRDGYEARAQEAAVAEFSLQALHDEIEADPMELGYKNGDGTWKEDAEIVDLINAANYTIDRASVEMEDVRAVTVYEAYDGLGADEQEWLRWITPGSGLLRVTADVKLRLTGRTLSVNGVAGTGGDGDSFWALADNAVASDVLALVEIDGSRAEVLWGEGRTISISNVGHAANL